MSLITNLTLGHMEQHIQCRYLFKNTDNYVCFAAINFGILILCALQSNARLKLVCLLDLHSQEYCTDRAFWKCGSK